MFFAKADDSNGRRGGESGDRTPRRPSAPQPVRRTPYSSMRQTPPVNRPQLPHPNQPGQPQSSVHRGMSAHVVQPVRPGLNPKSPFNPQGKKAPKPDSRTTARKPADTLGQAAPSRSASSASPRPGRSGRTSPNPTNSGAARIATTRPGGYSSQPPKNPAASYESTPEAKRRRQKLRRDRNRAIALTVLIAITVVLTAVLIRSILNRGANETSLRFISSGTLYQTIDTKALIIRDETVLRAGKDGYVYPLAGEGSQVAYGKRVALLATGNIGDLQEKLENVRRQIAYRELDLISEGQGDGAQELYQQAESALKEPVRNLAEAASLGDLRPALREGLRISNAIEERNRRLNDIVFEDPVLKELQQSRHKLENELASVSESYVNPVAGLISFSTDGLEKELDYHKINDLTVELLDKCFKEPIELQNTTGERKKDDVVLRMVNGSHQYIVFDVPEADMPAFAQAETISCFFPDDNVEIKRATVQLKINHKNGTYLIAETDQDISRFIRNRRLNVQLRTRSESGLIVPLSALQFTGDDKQYANLVTVQSGFAHFVQVKVLLHNSDRAVIQPLEENTGLASGSLVVQNPGKIKEGDKLE